ncbi:MAG TPA: hypothetical protein VH396_09065 [Chitinophagaceae bacterium]
MTTRYKILFAVDLLNDYYTDRRCDDFTVIASAEAATLLKKYQLLYKVVGNKLVVLTKVNSNDEPLTAIGKEAKFVFYLDLKKPVFVNFTNLDLNELKDKRFYFTNLNQNKLNTTLNITAKLDEYDNAKSYRPGALVDNGTNNIFECIQNTAGNNTTNTAFWISRGVDQFVSPLDMIVHTTKIFNHEVAVAATEFKINIFSLNTTTNSYTDVAKTETQKFDQATKNLQVDLSSLSSGKYRMTINGEELFIYASDEFVYGGYFGIIEIFSHLSNTNDFAFLDNTGKVKEITYTIHFANRMAFWKYITPKQGIKSITDNNNIYVFDPTPALPAPVDFFTSTIPIPLNETARSFTIKLVKTVSSEDPAAPNPDLLTPGVLTKTGDDFLCNIYLNY